MNAIDIIKSIFEFTLIILVIVSVFNEQRIADFEQTLIERWKNHNAK